MNQLAHLQGKFKNLSANELLQVVEFYKDENKFFDNISFNEFYQRSNKIGDFKRSDVENYFTSNFYPLETLKDFYKYWKD